MGNKYYAHEHACISVLFADIVGESIRSQYWHDDQLFGMQ